MDSTAMGDAPVKDHGRDKSNLDDKEIQSHRKDRIKTQNMYVGLHFPSQRKRRHRHRHNNRQKEEPTQPNQPKPPTPPSQRVQFLLGGDDDESHRAHEMFCEMEELRAVEGETAEWKETARWVKFEEDVEEEGDRWSKPYVATLSLHSLFELRKGLMSGTVMLDMEANDLAQITGLVLDSMTNSQQLEEEHREQVQNILLSRHTHQHENKDHQKGQKGLLKSLADIGRKHSSKNIEDSPGVKSSISNQHLTAGHLSTGGNVPSCATLSKSGSSGDLMDGSDIHHTPSMHKFNEHFLKKIPVGAEASSILVGEVDFLKHPIIAFVRLKTAQLLGDLTEVPVPTRFIFCLLGPTGNQPRYHEIGRSIATLMSDEIFHDVAYHAKDREDLLSGIDEFLDQVTVLPPGEWDPTIRIEPPKCVPSQSGRLTAPAGMPNGSAPTVEEEPDDHSDPALIRTGRLFGGLIADVKRRMPYYLSDFTDALHVQCIASLFFMYFACLTPIITFGGLLGTATDNNMAAMESLLAGSVCGISYHLFSGQPLTIIGSTGPVLVFETIVHNFCEDYSLHYLSFRLWIGVWVSLILLIIVAFDLSALVRYITRFTEESFAALIALIFIFEAFKKLIHISHKYEVNRSGLPPPDTLCFCEPSNASLANSSYDQVNWTIISPEDCVTSGGVKSLGCSVPHYMADVFLFSVILFIGTFTLAYVLKYFRSGHFLPARLRGLISDFAVMIAITLMVVFDAVIHLKTPKLEVPVDFKPTRPDRGWVVYPFENPIWTIPVCIAPALLATILIFMDQQITAVIVNRKENKLIKGSGYHLDLFVIAIQIGLCSVMGLPWFVAATVLSINHVRSLTRESDCSAPGEKPKFLGVREQRLTGIIVFFMVGLSVLMTPLLLLIPMPVLYGVFLYMGVSSMVGVQLVQRCLIVFMPPKYQPDYTYLRHVPLRRVHLFTAIQVICLGVLWAIKTIKSISIVFPLMVLAMCFVRKGLDYVFTRHELRWLDDILPVDNSREDKQSPSDEEVGNSEQVLELTGGQVSIPLSDGKSINIPVDKITYDPSKNKVNISDEMSKTAIWRQLAANEQEPSIEIRKRKPDATDLESGGPESERMMPQIKVMSPSAEK